MFQLGPKIGWDRPGHEFDIGLDLGQGHGAGNDAGDSVVAKGKLDRGCRQGHVMAPAHGLDATDPVEDLLGRVLLIVFRAGPWAGG